MNSSSIKKRILPLIILVVFISIVTNRALYFLMGNDVDAAAALISAAACLGLIILLLLYIYKALFYYLFFIFLFLTDALFIYCLVRDFSNPVIGTMAFVTNVLYLVFFLFRNRYRPEKRSSVKFILEEKRGKYIMKILFAGASEEKKVEVLNRIRTRYPYREIDGERVYELTKEQMELFVDKIVAKDEEVRIW